MTLPPPAILLMGPTASGKTALALEMARHFPVEVVSVDSALVYRDMDIGTAKPTAEERAVCPHHLMDIITPEETYSAARFREDAVKLMVEITGRGRIPVLAGGTMLYFKALREGLSSLPAADPALRAEIEEEAARRGWPALHKELARLDPQAAARLKPNDAQRIQRALEIVRLTGLSLAQAQARRQEDAPLPCRLLALGLMPSDRAVLHERIAARFAAMLAAGLVGEVAGLRHKYRLSGNLPSMRCVGYRQVWDMLEGRLAEGELLDRGIFATRQLAKRQLTWLRGFSGIHFLDCLDRTLPDKALAWCEAAMAG